MTERELEERRRPGVGQWVVASLLLHAVIVSALFFLPLGRWADQLRTQRTDPPPIEFDIIDDRGQLPPSLLGSVEPAPPDPKKEAAKPEEEKKPEDDPDAKGQVVELPPPKEEKRPDKSDFVSEYNVKVNKQTRARVRGPKAGSAAGAEVQRAPEKKSPAPPSPPSEAKAEATGSEGGQKRQTGTGGQGKEPGQAEKEQPAKKPQLLAMRTEVRRGSASEAEVGLSPAGEAAGTGEAARKERGKHEASERPSSTQKGLLGQPAPPGHDGSVLPSFATSSRATGGGPDDYLKNIDEGEDTALNSKQWRYASFFNRVKRQVAQKWHPDVVYRRFDPSGQVFGTRDRFTVVRVMLNRDGSLKTVALEKRSGVEFLDEEALSALRQAQPFVNPPTGLIDKQSGLISFRFGFFFEINSSGKLKLFRY